MEWRAERGPTRSLFDEALRFVVDIKHGTARDVELIEWTRRSAEHTAAFLEAWHLYADVAGMTAEQRRRIDALAAAAAAPSATVVWLADVRPTAGPDSSQRFVRRTLISCVSVSACACFGLVVWFSTQATPTLYETGNHHRSIVTRDGSRLHLNSQTRVRTRFRDGFREVELLKGEVLFDVAPDARRPFRVASGGTVARAQDTQFDVRLTDHAVSVTVNHGEVAVAPFAARASEIVLRPGQRATVDLHLCRRAVAEVQTVDELHMSHALAWVGWIALEGRSLSEVIERFNSANRTQIRLGDDSIGTLRLGGSFSLVDPDGFVNALYGLGVEATRSDRRTGSVYRLRWAQKALDHRRAVPEIDRAARRL